MRAARARRLAATCAAVLPRPARLTFHARAPARAHTINLFLRTRTHQPPPTHPHITHRLCGAAARGGAAPRGGAPRTPPPGLPVGGAAARALRSTGDRWRVERARSMTMMVLFFRSAAKSASHAPSHRFSSLNPPTHPHPPSSRYTSPAPPRPPWPAAAPQPPPSLPSPAPRAPCPTPLPPPSRGATGTASCSCAPWTH